MTTKPTQDGWSEWSRYVLKELEALNKRLTERDKQLLEIHVQIATLMVKSGVWGALAGLVPAAITLLVLLLKTWK